MKITRCNVKENEIILEAINYEGLYERRSLGWIYPFKIDEWYYKTILNFELIEIDIIEGHDIIKDGHRMEKAKYIFKATEDTIKEIKNVGYENLNFQNFIGRAI